MEYSKTPVWNPCKEYRKKTIEDLTVSAPDERMRRKILENWDNIAKPIDGMGEFERLTAQIGAIQGTEQIRTKKKAVLIMCADNGIVEEGVSQSGQEVTLAVVKSMAKKTSSVGRMAAFAKADTIPVDIGICSKEKISGVLDRKIRCGTRNFRKTAAMTEEETVKAVLTGIACVEECREKGYHLLAAGEMGIGNTTTSSAIAAALLKCGVQEVTGRGAGLTDDKLIQKQMVIREALDIYRLREAEPFQILETVGGLDIAGLVGVCIGGALFRIPVVLDGVISLTAALLAERLVSGTKEYLLASHKGKEPAACKLLEALGLRPVIDAEMALGEGTGAVMLFQLLEAALCIYRGQTKFEDIQIARYERISER